MIGRRRSQRLRSLRMGMGRTMTISEVSRRDVGEAERVSLERRQGKGKVMRTRRSLNRDHPSPRPKKEKGSLGGGNGTQIREKKKLDSRTARSFPDLFELFGGDGRMDRRGGDGA